jgi:hypothetical protein
MAIAAGGNNRVKQIVIAGRAGQALNRPHTGWHQLCWLKYNTVMMMMMAMNWANTLIRISLFDQLAAVSPPFHRV